MSNFDIAKKREDPNFVESLLLKRTNENEEFGSD
jgi:hypothetical protein